MPDIRFTKMHGGGNDFVVIDGLRQKLPARLPAMQLAARRTGIGCDQILILQKPMDNAADFTYRIINADGGEVGQCGNGARCVHAFVRRHKLSSKKQLRLRTHNVTITTKHLGKDMVRAYLATPQFAPADIPLQRKQTQHWYAAPSGVLPGRFAALSLGNPHAVFMVEKEPTTATLTAAGKMLNRRRLFPQGVNVSFCRRRGGKIFVRVYERGVGETPSCGSAAVAAAVVALRDSPSKQPLSIMMPGGDLLCGWAGGEHAAWLQGKINFVFDGIIRMPPAVK